MSIDLRALRNFVAVASSGSISRAAEVQHLAQPALSLQIKRIEQDLGTELFTRHPRGVALTEAGEKFLTHAIDILKRIDVACEEIRLGSSEPSGVVAVGAPQSVARYLALPVVASVVQQWPQVHLQWTEMGSAYVPEEILRGRIDLGLTFGAEPDARLRFTRMLDEDLLLYASPLTLARLLGPDKAPMDTIGLRALQNLPIIMPSAGHSLRTCIDGYLERAGVRLRVIAEVNSVPLLLELAQADVGATIVSLASIAPLKHGSPLRALRIIDPAMQRSVYCVKLATTPLTLAVSKVEQLIHATVSRLVASGAWPCTGPPPGLA